MTTSRVLMIAVAAMAVGQLLTHTSFAAAASELDAIRSDCAAAGADHQVWRQQTFVEERTRDHKPETSVFVEAHYNSKDGHCYLDAEIACPAPGLPMPNGADKPTGKCDREGRSRELLDGQTHDLLIFAWVNWEGSGGTLMSDDAAQRRPDLSGGDWLANGYALADKYIRIVMSE